MFGLLRVKSCVLGDEGEKAYKATFCSACHAMHQFSGRLSSLATNYDITLWLTLAQALDPQEMEMVRRPCTAMPLQKVNVFPLRPQLAASVAALNLGLIGAKIQDNVEDGSALWGLADSAFEGKRRKAISFLEETGFETGVLIDLPGKQSAAESDSESTLESLASPTAEAMEVAFAHLATLLELPELRSPLGQLGAAVGRFVYLWDATLDRDSDQRKGEFNALLATGTQGAQVRERLLAELDQIETCLSGLPLRRQQSVFTGLLASLRGKVRQEFPQQAVSMPRMGASKAAFLRTQDCDCCEFGCSGCCEVDFCPCGNDGCGIKCCQCCDCCDSCCCC